MEPANKNSCGPENPVPKSEIKNVNVSFLRTASNWSVFALKTATETKLESPRNLSQPSQPRGVPCPRLLEYIIGYSHGIRRSDYKAPQRAIFSRLRVVFIFPCLSTGMRGQLLFCSSSLLSPYITLISPILTELQVPRCRPKIAMHMEFNWRLDLVLSLCPLWLRGRLWRGWRLGCSQCWHLHRFFSAQLSSSLAPQGRQQLIPGTTWNSTLIYRYFPLTIKKYTKPSSHKAFLFPLRSLTYTCHELNSGIQGIHVFEGYILKTFSDYEAIIHFLMIHWKEINLQLNQYLFFKFN